ncbi:flagellar basal body-associated FliL family protein [Paracoccus sp. (in: a-proteobacteria)]|uniref:flagellar basal body-associated FliL family protein n=1 Tax=Paracoccus sp. TaxID=267 RepID=UPI002729D9DA|nr:flagellar basal body-associated FliL family protein [Paracoccus sp. (in: a-proteobacteria)]
MADAIAQTEDTPPRSRGMLLAIIAALALGGGGFGSTFVGLWSPSDLLHREAAPAKAAIPAVEFVNVPPVEVIVPGPNSRTLIVQAAIETDAAHRAQVEHLMPRISDLFTTFLSGVDPAAYQRRGVLEVIRAELVTRTRLVLGEEPVRDLLITEFRFK